MRATTLLAGTAAAVLVASPILAQTEITQEGADEIRQALVTYIDESLADLAVDVDFAGEIEVIPAGDAYEATLPEATLRFDGGSIVGEEIDLTLIPLDNGWYDARWTLPERVTIEEGGEAGFVVIGNQSSEGVFAPAFETFMSMDVVLEAIEVIPPPGEEGSLSLERLSLNGNSQDLGGQRYSGNYTFAAEGFNFVGEPGREALEIGELRFDWSVTDLDFPAYFEFQQALEALRVQAEAQSSQGQPPVDLFAQASSLLAETPALLDGIRARYRIDDIVVIDGTQNVDIESGSFALYLEGLRGSSSTFGIELTTDEIAVVPAPPEAQFFPIETRARLALVDLPNEQLLNILSQFLTSAGQMGPDAAAMMAGLSLQQAVMAGGSTLQVQEVVVVTETASLDLMGEVVPDQAAAFGVVANATMTIAGLPDLIAELQQTLGVDAQEPVQVLTVLQTMGAQTMDDTGRDVRTYEFEVLQTGQILLNGADMAPLMGAFQ